MRVPVLALVINPVVTAGPLLAAYVVSDIFGLYAYRHAYDRRVLAIVDDLFAVSCEAFCQLPRPLL